MGSLQFQGRGFCGNDIRRTGLIGGKSGISTACPSVLLREGIVFCSAFSLRHKVHGHCTTTFDDTIPGGGNYARSLQIFLLGVEMSAKYFLDGDTGYAMHSPGLRSEMMQAGMPREVLSTRAILQLLMHEAERKSPLWYR